VWYGYVDFSTKPVFAHGIMGKKSKYMLLSMMGVLVFPVMAILAVAYICHLFAKYGIWEWASRVTGG